MSCDWEGNRRSRVALANGHASQTEVVYPRDLRAQGLSKGDEHPTNTFHGVGYGTLYHLPIQWQQC